VEFQLGESAPAFLAATVAFLGHPVLPFRSRKDTMLWHRGPRPGRTEASAVAFPPPRESDLIRPSAGRRARAAEEATNGASPAPSSPLVTGAGGAILVGALALLLAAPAQAWPVVQGMMIGGFAAIAWPATYEVTGVQTFQVNNGGLVYRKDL